ncbi:hypothetical protein M758_11G033100 [Ceratodon purpureus]|nr:hypothetical protein M758_11G033100 [Ceratodon purpureus]
MAKVDSTSAVNFIGIPSSVLIIGAGPAGLATAACLASKSIPFVILERKDCTASLWKKMTYDRLHLHLPKKYCELPLLQFPESYPKYPSRDQFIAYLDNYAKHFRISPMCNTTVVSAEFAAPLGLWVVTAEHGVGKVSCKFTAKTLVVATGENGEAVVPSFLGREDFAGKVIHGKEYRNGKKYRDEKVLVVGTGNTGMEIALDLANFGAQPTIVARSPFHVMPRELFGVNISTFDVSMKLLKVFPLWFVDKCIVYSSWLTLGDTAKYNLIRPEEGPLAMKARTGQTPVLDVGTVAKIRNGDIKVMPGIDRLTENGAKFVNGMEQAFDVIIMATGYASTVSKWLKAGDGNMFGGDGFPKNPFPNGWKGENGIYAVGFGRKGLLGCAHDARRVAEDIAKDFT